MPLGGTKGRAMAMKEVVVLRRIGGWSEAQWRGWSEGQWRWRGGGGVATWQRWRSKVGEEEVGKVLTLRIRHYGL